MGQQTRSNFEKRFGDRIHVVYAGRSSVLDKQLRKERLCKAIIKVLTGILGREPTQRELLGIDELTKNKKRR
jgi:hypothetical protein